MKTRLGAAIGAKRAAELYAAFVTDLARRFAGEPYAVRWAIAPPDRGFARRFSLAAAVCAPQRGPDLGARLGAAFAAARAAGFTCSAVIGTDMPQLEPATVREALARLEEAELVLGPADDGGYYLIAMREPHEVFAGIEWSSPRVLEQTLDRARSLGLRTALLEPGFDVDTVDDLVRLRGRLASPAAAAALPATAAILRGLDLEERDRAAVRTRSPRRSGRRRARCR